MKYLKRLIKGILAMAAAVAILNGIFHFYFSKPMFTPSHIGNTDFVFPPNASWYQMVEGISHGRFDAQGFNNPEVIQNPDILILGSSHMEATYIMQKQQVSARLQALLGGDATVYNMGISGGNLRKCLQYLPRTLSSMEVMPKLIVIEASEVAITEDEVAQILESRIPSIFSPKPDSLHWFLSMPFIRTLAMQKNLGLMELLNPPRFQAPHQPQAEPGAMIPAKDPRGAVYDPLFSYLENLSEQYGGVRFLICCHPAESLQSDGSVIFQQDPWSEVFAEKCRDSGIGFIDLTEAFQSLYTREHLLPHGFITGSIGTGHLNAHGHQAMAEAIYAWIQEGGL